MSDVPRGPTARCSILYSETSQGVLVYLIGQSNSAVKRRRSAACYILDCLRSYRTPEETAACLHQLDDGALLDLGSDVRELATELGLLH